MPSVPHVAPDARRPVRPHWLLWVGALVLQALGLVVAAGCFVWAWFALPRHGLFSTPNDAGTRLGGAIAATLFGPALLAGPLAVGAARRDRRWLVPAGALAGTASLALLVVTSRS